MKAWKAGSSVSLGVSAVVSCLLLAPSCREDPVRQALDPDATRDVVPVTDRRSDTDTPDVVDPLEFSGHQFYFVPKSTPSGLSKAEYAQFSVEYDALPVPSHLKNILTFSLTPMMPPWRRAQATPGPVVLYSDDMEVWVISPMDHFFLSLLIPEPGVQVRMGLNGDVDAVPGGFYHRFVVVKGHGMQRTLEHWGDVMRGDRDKGHVNRYTGPELAYIGYWTDNGAYYYYKTEPGMNEQETMLAVKAEADEIGIPYGYLQLDSWWYFKAEGEGLGPGGLLTWEPQPHMFPDGLEAFQQALGLPLVLHNRWFSTESPYLDSYPFMQEGGKAFPLGENVYFEFTGNAVSWGATMYEQDWLALQFLAFRPIRGQLDFGKDWMTWMDDACEWDGLNMQLCMASAPHVLASLDMKSPTTVRTSIDYAPGISKESFWPQFHTVNMIVWGLGLLPFKDNFHSSERHGEAEALISVLSAGMVGLGDELGKVVKPIVMRTCRADGMLLKPDRPAFPVDAMFLPHQRPFTTYTYSETGAGAVFYLAAYHLAREHPQRSSADRLFASIQYDMQDLGDSMPWPDEVTDWQVSLTRDVPLEGPYVAYNWRTGAVREVKETLDLPVLPDLYDFHFYVLSPVQTSGLAFIGEPGKYVTASDKRFPEVTATTTGFDVTVQGVPGEVVELTAYDSATKSLIPTKMVTIGPSGQTNVSLP